MITELVFYKQDSNSYDERFPLSIKVDNQTVNSTASSIVSSYTQSGGGLKLTLSAPVVGTYLLIQFNGTNQDLIGGYTSSNGQVIELSAIDIMGYVFTVDSSCVNDDSTGDSYGDTCTQYYDAYPLGCGFYETSTFNSSAQCCACGGGNSSSSRRQLEWGGLSQVAEPELETTPVGSHDYSYSTTYSYYSGYSYSYSYYDYYYSSYSYSYSYSDYSYYYSYYDYSSYDYYSYSYGYYDYYYGEYYDSYAASTCDCGSEP